MHGIAFSSSYTHKTTEIFYSNRINTFDRNSSIHLWNLLYRGFFFTKSDAVISNLHENKIEIIYLNTKLRWNTFKKVVQGQISFPHIFQQQRCHGNTWKSNFPFFTSSNTGKKGAKNRRQASTKQDKENQNKRLVTASHFALHYICNVYKFIITLHHLWINIYQCYIVCSTIAFMYNLTIEGQDEWRSYVPFVLNLR